MLSTIRELQDSLADRPPWHLAFAVWVVHGWLDGFVTTASVAYHLDSTMESNPLYRPYLAEAHLAFVHSESYIHYWKPIALKLVVAGVASALLLGVAVLVSRRAYAAFCSGLIAAGLAVVAGNLLALGQGWLVASVAVAVAAVFVRFRFDRPPRAAVRSVIVVGVAFLLITSIIGPFAWFGGFPGIESDHNGVTSAENTGLDYTLEKNGTIGSNEMDYAQEYHFKPDGSAIIAYDSNIDKFYQYSLSDPWDIDTATYEKNVTASGASGLEKAMYVTPNGKNAYTVESDTGNIMEYSFGTAWDISTINYEGSTSYGSFYPRAIWTSEDGSKLYISDDGSNIHQWDISNYNATTLSNEQTATPSDLSGAVYDGMNFGDDQYLYITDYGSDEMHQYEFGTPGDITTLSWVDTRTVVFGSYAYRIAGLHAKSNGQTFVAAVGGYEYEVGQFNSDLDGGVASGVSGRVTDQYGEPVQNATVAATEINQSNTINIGSRTLAGIYDDPTPAEWNQQVNDLESFDESQFNPDWTDEFDEQRVLMHSREDWDPQDLPEWAFYSDRVYEGSPPENIPARPVLDAEQDAVFACWTPDGSLAQDGIDRSIPGAETTDCSITVEQIDPLGNQVESRTVESQPVHSVEHYSNVGEDGWLTKDHHAATLDLDPGVYKVYPEGSSEDALYYSIAEGQDPATLRPDAENWQSACDSGSTSQPWHDKVCDKLSSIGTDRATTNATGHYELYMDAANVDSVQLTAVKDASLDAADETMTADEVSTQFETTVKSNFKSHEAATSGPRQYLENNDRESFRQICREMPSVGEEVGAPFFGLDESSVPSSSADIQGTHGTAPYADNVIKECAAANMVEDILNDNLGWLDGGFLDDLENLQDPHEKLEELLPLLLADPALQEEVEDRTGIQLDSSSPYDYTKSEARQILDEGGSALDGGSSGGGGGGPYVGGGDGSVDGAAGTISETWPVVGVDDWSEAAIMVRLDWSNGTTTTLNDSSEYVTIDENAVGADEVRLEDYPLAEQDPAAVKPRLDVSTPDGSDGDERPGRRNPHFDGQIPGLKHVKLSSVRPGPDESVTVEVDGDDGLQGLQRVEVTNPDGSTSTVTPTDGTATVTTSGEGTHRLEVVVTNPGGTEFTEVLRLEAGSSASDRPPTVRAATGVTGRYAVASDGMQGASVEVSNGASQVDVVGLLKTDSPGQVVVDTASASIAPDVTHNVELRYGDDEQRLGTSTGLVLRQPPTSESALHYREGRPITTSGGTEGTVKRTDNATVYDTYTAGDGTLTTRTIDDPGILQRIWFNVRVRSPIDPGSIGDSTGMVAPNTGVAA